MFLALVFIVLVVAAVALGWGEIAAYAANATLNRAFDQATAYELHIGERTLLNSLRQQIAAGATTLVLPSSDQQTLCASQPPSGPCQYIGTIAYASAGGSLPVTGSSAPTPPPGGQTQATYNMQTLLSEGVVALDILASVTSNGIVVARRGEQVTIRLETAAPYASVASRMDLADVAGNTSTPTSAGDYGGCDPANVTTCDAAATQAPGDTRLAPTPTCTVDPSTGACGVQTPPPATYWTTNFTNNNDESSGWSR